MTCFLRRTRFLSCFLFSALTLSALLGSPHTTCAQTTLAQEGEEENSKGVTGVKSAREAEQQADAVPTEIVVRAIAQDAKVIQSSVGGAHITIRSAETGEVLAEGVQQGGSGSTEQIMRQPHRRGVTPYATEDAARFKATLMLSEPTRVEVAAEGPLDFPQAMQRTQTTLLLVPGEHVRGSGIVLPLRGFIVELLAPGDSAKDAEGNASLATLEGSHTDVRARVQMLCGCPTTPGGLWDSRSIEVRAQLVDASGRVAAQAPLEYAGTTSTYEGRFALPEGAGAPPDEPYRLRVLATDPEKTNLGSASQRVEVR